MSGFADQRQQLRKALVGAGLPPDAAARIANILGNSAQAMTHAGPVTVDNTPAGLRYVTPAERKLRFANLDHRAADPDHRPQRGETAEEQPVPEPEPNVLAVVPPQQTAAQFRVAPGSLTDVVGRGQAAQVSVRNVVNARPPGGLPLTMLDSQANQLVGKAARAAVNGNDGTARFDVQENNREVVWNLQMLNRSEYDVVTGVAFVPGKGLEVTYQRIKAWDQNRESVEVIPTVDQTVVTDVVDDKYGLRGTRRTLTTFASVGAPRNFFNTYRIGRFTGGWQHGTDKEIEQVWPTSGTTPTVKNVTTDVADTPEEKYVLFAVRTQDSVPPFPDNEDDPVSDPTKADDPTANENAPLFDVNGELVRDRNTPTAEYYAIEIQHATDCAAFTSLNGKTVKDLTGYDTEHPQALIHVAGELTPQEDGPPLPTNTCLEWRSHLVTVLTDVTLDEYGLTFTRQNVYVIAEGEPIDPLVIPISDCPT